MSNSLNDKLYDVVHFFINIQMCRKCKKKWEEAINDITLYCRQTGQLSGLSRKNYNGALKIQLGGQLCQNSGHQFP